MKYLKIFNIGSILFILTLLTTSFAFAGNDGRYRDDHRWNPKPTLVSKGIAATGTNRLLGQPIFDHGILNNGTRGFTAVAGYNPNGDLPIELTPDTPLNTILATTVDPLFIEGTDVTIDNLVVPVNIPIHRPLMVINGFDERGQLPHAADVTPPTRSMITPDGPVTLRQWLKAKGRLRIVCDSEDTSKVTIKFRNMIPYGVYTVWAAWGNELEPRWKARPFGGAPSAFIADGNGRAIFKRPLQNCPAIIPDDNSVDRLLFLSVLFHSDGSLYGAVPEPWGLGLPLGTVTQAHINFPVNVVDILVD